MPGPQSALMGQPPLTPDDELIVHGLYIYTKRKKFDISKGFDIKIKSPPLPHDASNRDRITVAAAICLVVIVLSTGLRLAIRLHNKSLVFGTDDWSIIFATVSCDLSGDNRLPELSF